MGHLVFVGDSYCASFQHENPFLEYRCIPHVQSSYPTYLNLSAQQLGCDFYSFGYPGRSWWFSRSGLLKFLHSQEEISLNNPGSPSFYSDIDAFIFCHSDANRLNTSNPGSSTMLLDPNPDLKAHRDYDPELSLPYKLWSTMLIDEEFQLWAMEKWFQEINELFSDRPMIHFNIAPYTVEISRQLHGVVYTTPLINISVGETTGTDEEISKSMEHDKRYNHFNQHNQSAMADLIVDTLTNYQPGRREIDLIKYNFDQPNSNAYRWPGAGFGTR